MSFLYFTTFTSRSFHISFLTDQMKGCMSNFQLLSRYLRQITRPDSATCDQESMMNEKRLSILHRAGMRKPDLSASSEEN